MCGENATNVTTLNVWPLLGAYPRCLQVKVGRLKVTSSSMALFEYLGAQNLPQGYLGGTSEGVLAPPPATRTTHKLGLHKELNQVSHLQNELPPPIFDLNK